MKAKCKCGCDKITSGKISWRTGKPVEYFKGHEWKSAKIKFDLLKKSRQRLCLCGCGELTSGRVSWRNKQPVKYKKGHEMRINDGKVWNYGLKGFRAAEKSHLWKGGITKENIKARYSFEGRRWSKFILKRDNYMCQKCGDTGCYLHAHHIKPFSKYPELRYDLNNGVALCKDCHYDIHNRKLVD